MSRVLHLLGASSLMLVLACDGVIGNMGEGNLGGDPPPTTRPPEAPPIDENGRLVCTEPYVPAGEVRRLTRDQYDASVATLLGDMTGPARAFPPDDDIEGFLVAGDVSPLLVEQQQAVAQALSERASMDLLAITGCDDAGCADDAIDTIGSRAFRRPLDDSQHARLRTVYDVGAENGGYVNGMRLVTQALLMSPSFLYHVEPQDHVSASSGDIVPVEGLALASRLSYFVWGTSPDDALLASAQAGELDSAEGLRNAAMRLLDDERAIDGFRAFYRQWLKIKLVDDIVKDPDLYPDFDAAVATDLRRSMELFMSDVFESGQTQNVYRGTTHYVNARIAPYFNLDPADYGDQLVPVDFDADRRPGILGHPGLMALLAKANQSDPIHRALFVRERLLCQHLPPPPDDLVVVAPDPAPGLTTRQRFAQHSEDVACSGCHRRLDVLGFGFEHYDAVGAWRDTDNGTDVDASGTIHDTEDIDGDFVGARELADRLASSEEAQSCVAKQFFRFALQRNETAVDDCSLQGIEDAFIESDYDLRELMLAIVASDAFRFQRMQ